MVGLNTIILIQFDYDDYIIRLAWIVLWWQTKGSNHIFIIFISTSPIVDDEDDGCDYGDDDDDDDDVRKLGEQSLGREVSLH